MNHFIKRFAVFMALVMMLSGTGLLPAFAEEGDDPVASEDQGESDNENMDEDEASESDENEDMDKMEMEENSEEEGEVMEKEEATEEGKMEMETDESSADFSETEIVSLEMDVKEALVASATVAEVKEVLEKVNHGIQVLRANVGGSGRLVGDSIRKRIERLQQLRARLRANLAANGQTGDQRVNQVKHRPAVYSIRWGVLDNAKINPCRNTDRAAVTSALEAGETPKCASEARKADYEGSISVNSGTLKVKNKVLFEKNDEVTREEGSTVSFKSHIAGHWDGLILTYEPPKESSSDLTVTVKIGSLNETFRAAQATGRKAIGNGHMIEIKRIAQVIPGLSTANQTKILDHKVKIQEKIDRVKERTYRLRLLNKNGSDLDSLEGILDEAENYNFDDTTSTEVQTAIDASIAGLGDDATPAQIRAAKTRLDGKIKELKTKAKARKFAKRMIPFKDTDDNEWYTEFVSKVKSRGIISGYKDAEGNDLGEFRPGNNITVAEILKIGLETSEKGSNNTGNPRLTAARNHWAKGYVKKAEDLKLDLVDGNVDLNRPATRGEVIRMMLEALGIDPENVSRTDFSDLPARHRNARFIQYAKKLGIVSGDAGKTTFRPDDPVNRAEVAKIADQTLEVLVGEN